MTTNETLIEFRKKFTVLTGTKRIRRVGHWLQPDSEFATAYPADEVEAFILSALQAKEEEMKEKIKSKKKYWHIRFEGISDPVISAERKKFNEEVSELINSVLDDLLSNLSK